ncbi:hypothetical protein [Flavisolibacter nicotianae]|uniref:hypothetical protein n=1 Tax=Flavisolibacter nicotianae TaxID=2364882 RepID=UPI000EB10CE9|nr:hypothetical protein [Flavisolibacter nicotianae]
MQLPRHLSLLLFTPLLTSCKWFQPTAYFFISNTSRDSKPVDIRVTLAGKTVFNDTIKYSGVVPDLAYTSHISLPKGKYIIKAISDSGKVIAEQPIDLGNNRWVFIQYSVTKPIDSADAKMLLTNFGNDTSWVNPKLRGTPPKVIITVLDKKPTLM